MRIRFLPVIFNQAIEQPIVPKMPLWKTVAFAAGLGLSMLSSVRAPPATGGDTVQGPCDSLLSRMQNGRTLGQSGRFHATGTGYLLRLPYRLGGAAVSRTLSQSDPGPASAADRELWALHCRPLRPL